MHSGLRSRLLKRIQSEEARAGKSALKGKHVEAGWGNQIRSYVFASVPDGQDHRTNTKRPAGTDSVLDGDLDAFIEGVFEGTGRGRRDNGDMET